MLNNLYLTMCPIYLYLSLFLSLIAATRHSPPPSLSSLGKRSSLSSPINDAPNTPNTTQDPNDADFGK